MATILPPPSKRQKLAAEAEKTQQEEDKKIPEGLGSVRVQFIDQATGQPTGGPVALPVAQANVKNLELLLNSLNGQSDGSKIPYRFSFTPTLDNQPQSSQTLDITSTLYHSLLRPGLKSTEDLITLHYTPLSVFRVRAVTRCSASISGHGEAILATQFSPSTSGRMVTGSGDHTARIWDCETGTPFATLKGHTGWVLAVAYSPDGGIIATGSYDKTVRLWDAATGKPIGSPLKGHTKWITSLAWEPYHLQEPGRPRLASASKDGSVRIWDTVRGVTDFTISRHLSTVSCVKWGGTGHIYTCSHDKTVKIFSSSDGSLVKSLDAHAHWVNHLALSSDFALRTAYHDHTGTVPATDAAKRSAALSRFETAARANNRVVERMVTASDDNTVYLWDTSSLSAPIKRLLGHQKQVNHVTFSPSGHLIASSGFDNLIKLWRADSGEFVRTLKGHVGAVYMVCFSADERLLCSCSKDTTVKVWEVGSGRLVEDLVGHKDEVFAVDWSVDGRRVGSGSRDRTVRIWTH